MDRAVGGSYRRERGCGKHRHPRSGSRGSAPGTRRCALARGDACTADAGPSRRQLSACCSGAVCGTDLVLVSLASPSRARVWPAIEAGAPDPEVARGLVHVPGALSVLENTQRATGVPLVMECTLPPSTEMSEGASINPAGLELCLPDHGKAASPVALQSAFLTSRHETSRQPDSQTAPMRPVRSMPRATSGAVT